MHPHDSFCGGASLQSGIWREVSVDGGVYALRESRSAPQKGLKVYFLKYYTNQLKISIVKVQLSIIQPTQREPVTRHFLNSICQ